MFQRFVNSSAIGCLIIASLCMSACQKKPDDARSSTPAASPTPAPSVAIKPTVELTEEDCINFGAQIMEVLEAGDEQAIEALTDLDLFLDIVQRGIPVSNPAYAPYRSGYKKRAQGDGGILGTLHQWLKRDADLEFLRAVQSDGQWRLVGRFIKAEDDGVGYFEIAVARNGKNQIRVSDMFMYTIGLNQSDLLRPYAIGAAVRANPDFRKRISKKERLRNQHYQQLKEIDNLVQSGDGKEALRKYAILPDSIKDDLTVQCKKLFAAWTADDDELFKEIIQEFYRKHPDSSWVGSIAWRYYQENDEPKEILKCIDRLDKGVGGDPYLDFYRAQVHFQLENYEKAIELADAAAEIRPDLLAPDFLRLDIALKQNNHKTTLEWLLYIADVSDVEFGDLADVEIYAEFRKSPQYQEWLEALKQ